MDASCLFPHTTGRRPRSHSAPGVLLDATNRGSSEEALTIRKRKYSGSGKNPDDRRTSRASSKRGRNTSATGQDVALYHPRPIYPTVRLASFLTDIPGSEISYNPGGVSGFVSDWVSALGDGDERPHSIPELPEEISAYEATHIGPRPLSAPTIMPPRRLPTPALSGTSRLGDTASQSSSTTLAARKHIDTVTYRTVVLRQHNYLIASVQDPLPSHIASLVEQISSHRSSPGPAPADINSDAVLRTLRRDGLPEIAVQRYFDDAIFYLPHNDTSVQVSMNQIMLASSVPKQRGRFKMSCPKPDLLYGYPYSAFTSAQADTLVDMADDISANSLQLHFPFLVVEYKGDQGSIYGATNQCMNASAACMDLLDMVNAWAEDLRGKQPDSIVSPVETAMFCIAMNSSEANVYVSCKSGTATYTHWVAGFNVQDADHFIRFRRMVRNIIDWGRGPRLAGIQHLLDQLGSHIKAMVADGAAPIPTML
ncbi:hypothetical protein F503_00453 [Ophiostoma piceae UAMH 11346]|uniref:DUF7924 domain-containing protein n=1 Tax=Ophiostoma piceae (strain UAMH 11346) TaxID=1262450 RepID=S3C764_OPHP1|nr:hypothetical protein F503_00453 [Ophiostoma piceae UAMH 11346]